MMRLIMLLLRLGVVAWRSECERALRLKGAYHNSIWCAEQSPSPVNSCIPAEIRTRSSDAICGGRVDSMSLLLSTTTETVRASVGINALLFAVCKKEKLTVLRPPARSGFRKKEISTANGRE